MVEGILLMADDYFEGQEFFFFFFNVGLVAGPYQAEYRAVWRLSVQVRRDGLGLRCPWWPSD